MLQKPPICSSPLQDYKLTFILGITKYGRKLTKCVKWGNISICVKCHFYFFLYSGCLFVLTLHHKLFPNAFHESDSAAEIAATTELFSSKWAETKKYLQENEKNLR